MCDVDVSRPTTYEGARMRTADLRTSKGPSSITQIRTPGSVQHIHMRSTICSASKPQGLRSATTSLRRRFRKEHGDGKGEGLVGPWQVRSSHSPSRGHEQSLHAAQPSSLSLLRPLRTFVPPPPLLAGLPVLPLETDGSRLPPACRVFGLTLLPLLASPRPRNFTSPLEPTCDLFSNGLH